MLILTHGGSQAAFDHNHTMRYLTLDRRLYAYFGDLIQSFAFVYLWACGILKVLTGPLCFSPWLLRPTLNHGTVKT